MMLQPTLSDSSDWRAKLDHLPIAFAEQANDWPSAIERSIDAAVWTRQLPKAVEEWLDEIPATKLPEGRFILTSENVSACLADIFAAQGLASKPAMTWLSKDILYLAHCIHRAAGTKWLRLRLENIDDDACSKLHVDNVVTRMICTYRGPGTQLGYETSAPDDVQTVPTGMPLLLKAKLWPSDRAPELRHRSPPIKGTGITRLVLVLEGASPQDIMAAYDTFYV